MQGRAQKLLYNNLTVPFRPFYRRYPYRGGISSGSANARGCLDLELGFFCNRIPKAANSTVVTNLARLKCGLDVPSKQAKKLFDTPAQLTRVQLGTFETLFKFTVVRNPYARTLSAYLDKVAREAPPQDPKAGFAAFLESLANGELHSNTHWAPQHSLMLIPVSHFDFIGKVEALDEAWRTIQSRIRPDLPLAMTSTLGNQTGANDKLRQYYDAPQVRLVQRLYAEDFSTFGYAPTFLVN